MAQIAEAKLYFKRDKIVPPGSETGLPVRVSELKQKGDTLLDFPTYDFIKDKGGVKAPVMAGSNVTWDKESSSMVAKLTGYPQVDMVKLPGDDAETMLLSVVPLLNVSWDKMTCRLAVHPPLNGGDSLIGKNIHDILTEEGIVYGIKDEVLSEAQDFVDNGCRDFNEFVVAEGLAPGEGIDARLEFHIEIGPIAGQILPDGSIDFRERRIMVPVSKNDLIATKHPAQPGQPGRNIYDEEVDPIGGDDIKVKASQDAALDEATGEVRATNDGILSVVRDKEIRVCANQIIEGDVDYEVGNLDSMSCITIQGDVQPGFKVKAVGDIEIAGGVMSAQVESLANVVVKAGITGQKSTVSAKGDADIHFVERGRLQAGENIVIRKQAYYSRLMAGGNILFESGSKAIGEYLVAGGSIDIGDVGSENAENAILCAGIDYERLKEYWHLKKELSDQHDAMIKWIQRYGGNKRSKKIRGMEAEIAETKLKLLQLNLIPGTGKYSRGGGEDMVTGSTPEDYSESGGIAINKISIKVNGKIFAGTTIMIGNRLMKLDKNLMKRQFKLSADRKRIIATPLIRR